MQPRNHQKRKRQSFLHGALILTVSMILVKLIGAMFKIPLTWIITEEGLGYFNTAYHFYSPIHSLATAGFPIAIARMVSENLACGRYADVQIIHSYIFNYRWTWACGYGNIRTVLCQSHWKRRSIACHVLPCACYFVQLLILCLSRLL